MAANGTPYPDLLTVKETAKYLRISRNKAYDLVAEGRIHCIHLGRKIIIPRWGLDQLVAQEAGLPQPPSSVLPFGPQRH
jgi:excisionase family DNA binding protein